MANKLIYDFRDLCSHSGADPERVFEVRDAFAKDGVWLGGGCLRRTLIKYPLDSDFDFFFRSEEAFNYWLENIPLTMKEVRRTKHHVQLEGTIGDSKLPVVVQGINFAYFPNGAPTVIDSFDYTITQFCLADDSLHTTDMALWDLGRMKLSINKVTYPVATMRRMLKYTKQGFTACAGCMQELFLQTAQNAEVMAQMDVEYVD
jgi:hypothetical protein